MAVRCRKGHVHDFRILKEDRPVIHSDIKKLMDSGYQGVQKIYSNTKTPKKRARIGHWLKKIKSIITSWLNKESVLRTSIADVKYLELSKKLIEVNTKTILKFGMWSPLSLTSDTQINCIYFGKMSNNSPYALIKKVLWKKLVNSYSITIDRR